MKSISLVLLFIGFNILSKAQPMAKDAILLSTDNKYILAPGDGLNGVHLDTNNIFSLIQFIRRFPTVSLKKTLSLSNDSINKITSSEAYWNYQNQNCAVNTWNLYSLDFATDSAEIIKPDLAYLNDSLFTNERRYREKADTNYLPALKTKDSCILGSFGKYSSCSLSDFKKQYKLFLPLDDYTKQLEVHIDTLKIERKEWINYKDSINNYTIKVDFLFKEKLLLSDTIETNVDHAFYVIIDNLICPIPPDKLKEMYGSSQLVRLAYDKNSDFFFLRTFIYSGLQSFKKKYEPSDELVTFLYKTEKVSQKIAFGYINKL